MVLRRAVVERVTTDDPRFQVAVRLAASYRSRIKAEYSVYAQPFCSTVPLEKQSVFTHFLKAAQIVIEEKGDPDSYMRAQFAGLRFCGKPPFPSQLHTSNARLRYVQWLVTHEQKTAKAVKASDYSIDEYEMQEIKLKRLMAGTKSSEREVLSLYRRQFTSAFLRSRKVAR